MKELTFLVYLSEDVDFSEALDHLRKISEDINLVVYYIEQCII